MTQVKVFIETNGYVLKAGRRGNLFFDKGGPYAVRREDAIELIKAGVACAADEDDELDALYREVHPPAPPEAPEQDFIGTGPLLPDELAQDDTGED